MNKIERFNNDIKVSKRVKYNEVIIDYEDEKEFEDLWLEERVEIYEMIIQMKNNNINNIKK